MIDVYKNSKVYVLCPAYKKTGGTELLHQLVNKLQSRGIDAYIVYNGVNENNKKYTAEDFEIYDVKFILEKEIEDKKENILIIPEIQVKKVKEYKNIRTAIWWLSVDNYKKNYMFISAMKLCGIKHAVKLLINGTIFLHNRDYKNAKYHLCQSEYAIDFLKKRRLDNVMYLSDYINDIYLEIQNDEKIEKEDIVLYNPSKGFRFTKKIINKSKNLRWIPIQNLTTEQVKDLLLKSKVYIDFGNHPGKDRFPREAAMCGCCVITGKRGAAKYYEDVPIINEFKFKDCVKNIESIILKIEDCLKNYESEAIKFSEYRAYIVNEKKNFEKDVNTIFERKEI